MKYEIHNNIEEKIIFEGSGSELIKFTERIKQENEDEFEILSTLGAVEYIETYCPNLDLIIKNNNPLDKLKK